MYQRNEHIFFRNNRKLLKLRGLMSLMLPLVNETYFCVSDRLVISSKHHAEQQKFSCRNFFYSKASLNTESTCPSLLSSGKLLFLFGVILVRIQSECGKMRTRITPNTDTFHAVFFVQINLSFLQISYAGADRASSNPGLLSSGKLLFSYYFEYATLLYSLFQVFLKILKRNFRELPQTARSKKVIFCNELQLQYRLYQMEPIYNLQCDMRQWNKITIQSLYR